MASESTGQLSIKSPGHRGGCHQRQHVPTWSEESACQGVDRPGIGRQPTQRIADRATVMLRETDPLKMMEKIGGEIVDHALTRQRPCPGEPHLQSASEHKDRQTHHGSRDREPAGCRCPVQKFEHGSTRLRDSAAHDAVVDKDFHWPGVRGGNGRIEDAEQDDRREAGPLTQDIGHQPPALGGPSALHSVRVGARHSLASQPIRELDHQDIV